MKTMFTFGIVLFAFTELLILISTKPGNHNILKFMLVSALLMIILAGVAIMTGYGDA